MRGMGGVRDGVNLQDRGHTSLESVETCAS